jgi:hypothetical protein
MMKLYRGPALPADQTALVESGAHTHITRCDGLKITSLKAAVLPGEHVLEMAPAEEGQPYRGYLFHSTVTGSVGFDAEAGHAYTVHVDIVTASTPVDEGGSGYEWIGYVRDRSSGKVVASTVSLPLEAYPMLPR